MRPLHPIQIVLVLFLLLACSMSSKATVLEDACKYVAAVPKDTVIGYDYCIKFFQADKGTATADKRGLALIAANITRVAAKNIVKRIAALRISAKGIVIQECLDYCANTYSKDVDDLSIAMNDITLGPAQDSWARSYLSGVLVAPDSCEAVFGEANQTSLLSAENSEFTKKAFVALLVIPSKQTESV